MGRGFKQLSARDRVLISKLREKKLSISEIARRIGKNKSTVSRELRRNESVMTARDWFWFRVEQLWSEEELDEYLRSRPRQARKGKGCWTHADAQSHCDFRRWRANQKRRRKKPETRKWIIEKLRLGWSPQQIAGRSKIDGPQSVSHEYVYAFLQRDKKRGGRLYRLLKRFRKRKQRLGPREYRAPTATDRVGIEQRPAIVAKRRRLGDCEADLIVGYRHSGYVLSVLDRRSRATVLRKVRSKDMDTVREQLVVALRQLGGAHTLTLDNGKEFYGHRELEQATRVRVFFAHPYCSTERGSIEHLNGLVRYYLPKRSSFATLSQSRLNEIQRQLNHRPRKCLGYLTPHEIHSKRQPIRSRPERCI
jgi:IS30 family transposase